MRALSLSLLTALAGVLLFSGCNDKPPPKVGLNVGDLAPEIDGEDVDGKKFKLSDYRGKVVVLSFWAMW